MASRTMRSIAAALMLVCPATACGSESGDDARESRATGPARDTVPQSVAPASATEAPASSVPAPAVTTTVPSTTPPSAAPTTVAFSPVPRVLLVGDSTLLAVESYEVLPVIRGMDPVYEAKSCRALAQPSCGENPAPNSVAVIDSAEGTFDMVVIMAGYDEWYTTFADSFDRVVASSRAKGAKRIVWLSYPEGVDYELPDGTPGNESLVNINQIMRDKIATGAFADVVIADWFRYSSLAEGWYANDDIHLTPTGAYGVADYISRKVAFIASLPCPMPREVGGSVEAPCPDPDVSGPVADVVALYSA
jgi:hypothetical protein